VAFNPTAIDVLKVAIPNEPLHHVAISDSFKLRERQGDENQDIVDIEDTLETTVSLSSGRFSLVTDPSVLKIVAQSLLSRVDERSAIERLREAGMIYLKLLIVSTNEYVS